MPIIFMSSFDQKRVSVTWYKFYTKSFDTFFFDWRKNWTKSGYQGNRYFLQSILLVSNTVVFRHILVLDTLIIFY
jgi:hypothetical protein